MNAKIRIGFVTDIEELMRRAQQERMAVRRHAWAELTAAIASFALRDVAGLLKPSYPESSAIG